MTRPLALLLFLLGATAVAQTTPPSDAPVQAKQPVETSVSVRDLAHLTELVKPDPEVSALARQLAVKDLGATGVIVGSIGAGALVGALGLFVLPKDYCTFEPSGGQSCHYGLTNLLTVAGGLGVMVAGTFIGYLMKPTRGDLLDVINAWNLRHAERPFELGSSR